MVHNRQRTGQCAAVSSLIYYFFFGGPDNDLINAWNPLKSNTSFMCLHLVESIYNSKIDLIPKDAGDFVFFCCFFFVCLWRKLYGVFIFWIFFFFVGFMWPHNDQRFNNVVGLLEIIALQFVYMCKYICRIFIV